MITVKDWRQVGSGETVLYIGRYNRYYNLTRSPYANPFKLQKESDRKDVLLQFAVWWYSPEQKWLREQAFEQWGTDEVLACWCHPRLCHGDIEAGYVNAKRAGLFDDTTIHAA